MLGMAAGASSARRRRVTYPVENLRVQVSALETVMVQVMAKPRREAVHQLRSVTRKVEAHLAVLGELAGQEPGLRAVARPARRVQKLLDLVRKAAGRVRDPDVQRTLARECVQDGSAKKLRGEVKEIRAQLKVERELAAAELIDLLLGRGLKLGPRLEVLMDALKPMEAVGLSAVEQEVMTRGWYAGQLGAARQRTGSDQTLHRIRKAAKVARYMAENGLAARVVETFKKLQEAGGRWHDCLSLRDAARERLGKRSELAALLKEREVSARTSFQTLVGD